MKKVAVVFYSFSGNTKRASLFLKKKLEEKGYLCDFVELRPKREVRSFLKQGFMAFLKRELSLEEIKTDLSEYDLVILASPVWAFTITPALRTYLNRVEGLKGRNVGCFLTFGSGTGKDKALRELKDILEKKGANILFSKTIVGKNTKEEAYLEREFRSLWEYL